MGLSDMINVFNIFETIKFDGQDVAGDCFHLSASGHAKIANAMFTKMHATRF